MKILKGIAHYYEQYHGVKIPDGVLRQAVLLSRKRYITDRFLPDKAIDLIDEACSDMNLKDERSTAAWRLKKSWRIMKREGTPCGGYQRKSLMRVRRRSKSREIQLGGELLIPSRLPVKVCSIENLARVIELWTKIPASKIKRKRSFAVCRSLESRLRAHIRPDRRSLFLWLQRRSAATAWVFPPSTSR